MKGFNFGNIALCSTFSRLLIHTFRSIMKIDGWADDPICEVENVKECWLALISMIEYGNISDVSWILHELCNFL